MARISRLALAGLLSILLLGPTLAQHDNTKLETVSYSDLGKLVRSYRGKPVLVYVWAEY